MTVDDTLKRLRLDPQFMQYVSAWERLPPRAAQYGPTPPDLHPALVRALREHSLLPLYTHQSDAIDAALNGRNVVIVTATASGKSLAYNIPVLHDLLSQPGQRALYLFPTKALAQDQAAALQQLSTALDIDLNIQTYDGDTPRGRRPAIRDAADIVISNPDMLHAGILPFHTRWSSFFAGLHYVVIDELHTYRGIFGSHVANVLRRLQRICRFYGSTPQFICTSATIANPTELAENLLEAPVTLVDNDGAPRAEKHVILYNPPLLDAKSGLRRAYTLETQRIARHFLDDQIQTVVFARTRNTAEIVLNYVRDAAQQLGIDPQTVRGYRGGYLASERREIELGLRSGAVRAVVATNALELGVDIGQLGAALLAGYPGTISSVWQQAGRAGRRSETGIAILIASAAPIDQYIARYPRYMFESPIERGLVNPDNLTIVYNHIRCAAFELPFETGEGFGRFAAAGELLDLLAEEGELFQSGGHSRWIGASAPAPAISLRTGSTDTVLIHDTGQQPPTVIGEVDIGTAPTQVYEGAIYLHEGRQYQVQTLDWDNRLAYVKPANVDFYTIASQDTELDILDVTDADESTIARRALGDVLVRATPVGYRMVKLYTHETLGRGDIHLPPREFQTVAYWLWIEPETVRILERADVLTRPLNYGPNWASQRNAARARDGFRCTECGTPEPTDKQHHVHHIRPFRTFGYEPGENKAYLDANALDNLRTLCPNCHHKLETAEKRMSALGGLAHALYNLAPLHLMCDPGDLDVVVEPRSTETKAPTITLYERQPDGTGMSAQLFDLHETLLDDALRLVRDCPCEDGCPACIGPSRFDLDSSATKDLTVVLIETLLGR